ncbi:hypothetical protein ACHQM5_008013 [Ranunculus cassubicifolius]
MSFNMNQETEPRTRSFRYEDYNNRRTFLRSYPLGEEEVVETVRVSKTSKGKKRVKKIFVCVFRWSGGKILILKHKVGFYLVACHPIMGSKILLA